MRIAKTTPFGWNRGETNDATRRLLCVVREYRGREEARRVRQGVPSLRFLRRGVVTNGSDGIKGEMMYLELLSRFAAGGSLVVVVTLLARTRFTSLAGILMLFPAVTLVGYYFAGQSMSVSQFQQITKFSVLALSTTFVFLATLYYTRGMTSLNTSLVAALLAWLISASVLVGVTRLCLE